MTNKEIQEIIFAMGGVPIDTILSDKDSPAMTAYITKLNKFMKILSYEDVKDIANYISTLKEKII